MAQLIRFFSPAILSALLPLTGWLALPGVAQAQSRRPVSRAAADGLASAPVPADPHELVTGAVEIVSSPADRLAALNLLRGAAGNGVSHQPKMDPFHFQATFTATGNLTYTGSGELTEIWVSGQSWLVTETMGTYSMSRIGYAGVTADQQPISLIPMRAQMLRNEIMWVTAINDAGRQQIRTSAAQWNGKPVTCILLSNVPGAITPTRLWEENEYCVANDSKLLQIHSIVPGTYAVFGYTKNLQFHGKSMADQIAIYVNGNQVIDSSFNIADPAAADQSLLAVPPQTAANGRPAIALSDARVITMDIAGGASGSAVQPVMIHLQLGADGAVLESEVSATANPSLTQRALDLVKTMNLGGTGMSHAFVNVRFLPAQ